MPTQQRKATASPSSPQYRAGNHGTPASVCTLDLHPAGVANRRLRDRHGQPRHARRVAPEPLWPRPRRLLRLSVEIVHTPVGRLVRRPRCGHALLALLLLLARRLRLQRRSLRLQVSVLISGWRCRCRCRWCCPSCSCQRRCRRRATGARWRRRGREARGRGSRYEGRAGRARQVGRLAKGVGRGAMEGEAWGRLK
jgi:hypothetical protein